MGGRQHLPEGVKIDWFRILFYCSLIFLIIWLLRRDGLEILKVTSPEKIMASLFFLFAAFLLDAYSWAFTLRKGGHALPAKEALASSGLSVFAKYIPGKVFVIISRALYLSKKGYVKAIRANSLSLYLQLCSIWSALFLGGLWAFRISHSGWAAWVWIACFISCTAWIFVPLLRSKINRALSYITKREIRNLGIDFISALRICFLLLLYWALLGIGFALLSEGFGFKADISVAMIFPFAAAAGIVAIFAPGGLGIREGVIVAALVITGLSTKDATGIALMSRIWYLIGEVFLFLVGLIYSRR